MAHIHSNALIGASGAAGAAGDADYIIPKSLRFNSGDSAHLSKTFAKLVKVFFSFLIKFLLFLSSKQINDFPNDGTLLTKFSKYLFNLSIVP